VVNFGSIWTLIAVLSGFGVIVSKVIADDDFFENKIRPVLVEHCYECHGPEKDALKGGLRVDFAGGLLQGGESGPALIQGKPEESLLLEALKYEGLEMPPSGKLPEQVVADFESWIRSGAPDPRTEKPAGGGVAPTPVDLKKGREFWAFQPLAKPQPPAVVRGLWPQHDIDRFVLAQLEQAGLEPNSDAPRGDLMRRLSFDLVGLPPQPEDLDRFLDSDESDWLNQYATKLIDSRQFGEHWGRHWLDVARYADSNGGDFNATFHNAWRYRNYVIDSFNLDRSLHDFVVHQIAGDLLPAASDSQREEQLVATSFLMLGTKMLSERDKAKLQMDVVDEQINTLGKAFLGMTLGCARCHDHKFDPIPMSDYYALAGILKSTQTLDGEIQKYVSNWVRQPLPITAEHAEQLATHQEAVAALKAEVKAAEEKLKGLKSSEQTDQILRQGVVVDDADAEIVGMWKASTISKEYVGQGYIHDDQKGRGQKSVTFRIRLPQSGKYEVRLAFPGTNGRATNVPVTVTHSEGEATIVLDQSKPGPIAKLLTPIGQFRFDSERDAIVVIRNEGANGYVIADAVQFVPVETLAAEPAKDSEEKVAETTAAEKQLDELKKQLATLEKNSPPPAPMALAVQDAQEVGDCQICVRGEVHQPGDQVPRGALSVVDALGPLEIGQNESGRLALAQWIASPDNPLTARVFVNRVWQHLLGEGIVASVDNFGRLGDRPSHPELLDYLTSEYVAHGSSTKWLVRTIINSRTYQLSSQNDEAKWEKDPSNRLLWRAHRKRLSAEQMRDAMLQAADRLDRSTGEDPVGHLGTLVTQNQANDQGYQQEQSNLRTVYLPIVRNELSTLMRAFDFADPDLVTGRRPETNVPAQALWLLNGPLVGEVAEQISQRLLQQTQAETTGEQVRQVFVWVLGRPATDEEIQLIGDVLHEFPAEDETALAERWTDVVHSLIASSMFRLLD
jgi:hypothetical protein